MQRTRTLRHDVSKYGPSWPSRARAYRHQGHVHAGALHGTDLRANFHCPRIDTRGPTSSRL